MALDLTSKVLVTGDPAVVVVAELIPRTVAPLFFVPVPDTVVVSIVKHLSVYGYHPICPN